MKKIERTTYLEQLISARGDGNIKVISGLRRCGKSYLLKNIFKDWLTGQGIPADHILLYDLENRRNKHLLDPDVLLDTIEGRMTDDKVYYILIDEVQKDYTIEHVLPRTWETYWRSVVEEFSNDPDADSQVPNPQKVLINTLGNLLLLDGSTNSGIGNNPWEIKHERINSGKSYGEYDVGLHSTWGKKEIEARGRDLLKFLGELIGCTFSEEQVQKALFASPELYAKGFARK